MTATTALRLSAPLVAIAPLLFEPTHASGDCSLDHQVSTFTAQHGATLSGPFGVEKVEAENKVSIRENGVTGVTLPFGAQNRRWDEMKAAMKPGDQIYHLVISDGAFHAAYFIPVRNECVIRSLMEYIT